MSSASARAKAVDPLSKRIPQNPKYKDVQHVVDTGASISKYMKKIEEIRANYRYQPNELFKRMKLSTFVQLVVQVSSVDDGRQFDEEISSSRPYTSDSDMLALNHSSESPAPSITTTDMNPGVTPGPETSRSTLQGLVTGHGEFDISHPVPQHTSGQGSGTDGNGSVAATVDCPYLLLDVRDKDEYDQCHIITAQHFPIALLSRSCNYESKEMLAFKNQTGKIILLYDEDERIAPKAATTLVERGYDNLFMLSGGLKVAVKLFPSGLVTGTPPPSIAVSTAKEVVRASQQEFFPGDIANLSVQMDVVLQDKSVGSRLSRASTRASQKGGSASTDQGRAPGTARSTVSSLSASSNISGRPAFKP